MNAVFFILLSLFLIVLQTVILPSFSWFIQCFDLLIINVLFLSLVSTHTSIIFAVILIGCIMDSISGVPFCYHIFSYIWIYIIVFIVKQLLFQKSIVFVIIMSVVSVLIQHGLLLLSIFVREGSSVLWVFDFSDLLRQVFWGFVVIPPSIWLINVLWQNWSFAVRSMQKQIVRLYRG